MKRKLLAVLVAVALAVVGCLALAGYVRGADRRAVAGRQAVWVLMAAQRIPAGTTPTEIQQRGYAKRVVMPAATVPSEALSGLDATLTGLALTADVQTSQLLLRGMFGEPAQLSGGLPLPEGRLAVSVDVSVPALVGDYVVPGAKVAVFDTFTMRDNTSRVPAGDGLTSRHEYNQATRILLPRVEVIAVGQRGTADAAVAAPAGAAAPGSGAAGADSADNSGGGASGAARMLVTFAVTQDEAARLVHAAQTGSLYLAMLDDTAKVEPGAGVDNDSLFP